MNGINAITYDLPNGVQLRIWSNSGNPSIHEIKLFLAEAMWHFAEVIRHSDGPYHGGPYAKEVKRRRKLFGKLELTNAIGHELSPTQWRQAVVFAHSRTNALRQFLDAPSDWLARARQDGSDNLEMYELLAQPGKELAALAIAMKRIPRA